VTTPLVRRWGRYVRGRARRAFDFAGFEFSPLLPPWTALGRGSGSMDRLRRLAVDLAWASVDSRSDTVFLAFTGLTWPLQSAVRALAAVRRSGAYVARAHGVSRAAQWWDAMRLANRLNFTPEAYYRYRLWDDRDHTRAPLFIQDFELGVLLSRINRGLDTSVIDNKICFFETCRDHDLPAVPIVATFQPDGGERWYAGGPDRLPARSLFIKLVDGMQGIGAERWVYEPVTATWRRRGVRLDRDGLVRHCRARGHERPVLLQHCLENRSDLARFSTGALCTFRVLTVREAGRQAEVMAHVFRMPRGEDDADNFHAHGIATAVDPRTGRLRPAVSGSASEGTFDAHPETGAPIAGVSIDGCLDEAGTLACQAHERLPVPWSVGWDVALTPDGPVLIEGNPLWGTGSLQCSYRTGLGEFPVTDRLLDRLRRMGVSAPNGAARDDRSVTGAAGR
jgi:Sugar-transfer associated ATP-grasp